MQVSQGRFYWSSRISWESSYSTWGWFSICATVSNNNGTLNINITLETFPRWTYYQNPLATTPLQGCSLTSKAMRIYKCWQEFYNIDENINRRGISRVREMEDEHDPNAPAPKPNPSDPKGSGKGGNGGKPDHPKPKKAPKPKTDDQLARAVPCFYLVILIYQNHARIS